MFISIGTRCIESCRLDFGAQSSDNGYVKDPVGIHNTFRLVQKALEMQIETPHECKKLFGIDC